MNMNLKNSIAIQSAFEDLLTPKTKEDQFELKAQQLAMGFLSLIDEAMENKRIKKKNLAAKVGTSASYITQLFSANRMPNFDIIAKMADATGVDFVITTKEKFEERLKEKREDGDGFWYYLKFNKSNPVAEEQYDFAPDTLDESQTFLKVS